MQGYNLSKFAALLCLLAYTTSAKKQQHHRDHKDRRQYYTSDGTVYDEVVLTSTLPPVTIYSTSYWTSYWTSVITQYSTVVFGDYTSTKTLVTPTTYQVLASSSVSQTTSQATSSGSTSIAASSLLVDFDVEAATTTAAAAENITTLFSEVATPYYMTTVNDGKTTVFFLEDVWYDSNGTPTSTNYEQYIGTETTIPYLDTTFFSTSTTTVKKTVTITTST